MGDNRESRREERRENYADRQKQQKQKNLLIGIAVLAAIVGIIAYASWHFIDISSNNPLSGPHNAGKLNGEHEHAGILVRIFGDKFDFSGTGFQVKSPYIHFEGQDGNTIHRHAANVALGFLFDSIHVGLTDTCYIFPDKKPEHTFCTNDDYTLKFFVNHEQKSSIRDYVLQEDDRILVLYGNENQTQIDNYLKELDSQIIKKK